MARAGARNANALAWNSGNLKSHNKRGRFSGLLILTFWEDTNLADTVRILSKWKMVLPASQCGLKQCCDAHTEKDGPNELTGGPLVEANTHGLSEEKRYSDGSTKTCQVVLQGQATEG